MRRLEIRMVPIRIRYITGGSIGHPVFPANRLATESRRADSNRLPLLQLRVIIHALQELARRCNPAYLSRFLFSALPCVASYCVRGGVRVVSKGPGDASRPLSNERSFFTFTVPGVRGDASSLDRYSHWI